MSGTSLEVVKSQKVVVSVNCCKRLTASSFQGVVVLLGVESDAMVSGEGRYRQ